MIDILNRYNIGKKKLIVLGLFVIFILLGIPLTIIQVQQQQNIKQHASAAVGVALELSPAAKNIDKIGEDFSTDLNLKNYNSNNVSAVDVTLTYNSDVVEGVIASPLEGWSLVYNNDTNIPGKLHYVLVNKDNALHIDSAVPLIRLSLKGKNQGTVSIGVQDVFVTATTDQQPLTVIPENNLGSYVIGKAATSTTPSASSPTPTYGDLNGDGIVDSIDYNASLRLKLANPATLAFLDFIQGSFEQELDPLMPHKLRGFGGLLTSITSFLNDFSLVYLSSKESKVADLTKQITVYDKVREEVESARSLDAMLKEYGELVAVSNGKPFLSDKGSKFITKKYDDLVNEYDNKCEQLRGRPVKERGICLYYPYEAAGKSKYHSDIYGYDFPNPAMEDILNVKKDEIRLIKELGNPEPLLSALADYDRVTRNGSEGTNEGLGVYYQLAKRFDEKKEFGSAIELYDAIVTNAPLSEIGRLSKKRIDELHSFGHQSKRVFFHIGASFADPTILIPINMCGPGSVGCKLIGKLLLKPAVITAKVSKLGVEKTIQFLVGSYGIRREAAEAVVEASSRLAKDEAGEVNLGMLVGKTAKTETKVVGKIAKLVDQSDLESEVQNIARIKGSDNYRNQFLSDIEKNGGRTIKAAQTVLSARVLGYVDDYVGRGFLSVENAKLFRQTADQMVKDMTEEYVNEGRFLFWKSIDTSKLMKIDELMHKTVAAVSHLEYVASSQRFSDHSYRHLQENLSKAMNAISGSSSFTRRDKIYLTFISLLHDIGYSATDIVQSPLNFYATGAHPKTAAMFVQAELQRDLKDVLGEKSAQIIKNTLETDIEEIVGKDGTVTIIDAIRKHGDKTFKYSIANLSGDNRVAAVFALADDLAVDKVPDLYRYPEIAKIVTDFFKAAGKRLDIAAESANYGDQLKIYAKLIKDPNSSSKASDILLALEKMDHGDSLLGGFRESYRQQMRVALEKYRSSIPDVRFKQYEQAIATTAEYDFPFVISPAIIEKTSFSIVNREGGKIGADVTIEISRPLYDRLSSVVGEENAKWQVLKILKDLVVRSSDGNVDAEGITKTLLANGGGQLGSGNNVIIKFVETQREASVLRDIIP